MQYLNDALSEFIDETDSNRAKFLLQNLNEAVALGKIIAIAPPSESDNPIIAEVY